MRFTALLLLTVCSIAPSAVVAAATPEVSSSRGASPLRHAMVAGHNAARTHVGLGPLRWSDALAADAAIYARELARTGRFEHSPEQEGSPQGENLWTGTRGAYAYREMVGLWVDERRFYLPHPTPDSSNSGEFGDVGHYTQIVWRESREMGCAEASSGTDDYVVCRYLPAGNVVGEIAF